MIDVMLSQATTGMVIVELLKRTSDNGVLLFDSKGIVLPNGQKQLLAIIPNIQMLMTVETTGEEE